MTTPNTPAEATASSFGLAAVDPPIPMLILERDFRIRWISTAAVRELQLRPERLIGRSWYELFPASRARRELHEALCSGTRDALDLSRVPLSLGCGTRYFSLRLRPLRAADGSIESILGVGEDVTSQVVAERALAANEARFRAISAHSTDIVVISAADGTVTFENGAVERILGPRRNSRSVISIYDNMHPDDLQRARELFERLVTNPEVGVTENIEVRKRHEDGTWRWLEFTASNLLDDPAVNGVVLNGRDITERKIAVLALRDSQAHLAAAVGGTGIGLWESGTTGDCHWLDNWCERFDIDPCDGPDRLQRWFTRIHADDLERYMRSDADVVRGDAEQYAVEYRILTRSGRWRWLHERGTVVEREAAGGVKRFIGVCFDIDEQKQLEAALRAAQDRYDLAINAARLPVWEYDVPSDTVRGNVFWHRATGYELTAAEARERRETWLSDVHPEDVARHDRVYTSALADESGFYQSEFRVRLPSGDYRWLLDRGRVVARTPDGQPLGVVGVSIDIDQQKRLQAQLRESEVRLETAIVGSDIGLWDWNVAADALRWLSDWPIRKGLRTASSPDTLHDLLSAAHPQDRARLEADIRSAITGGQDFVEAEYRALSVRQETCWVQVRAKVVERGSDGRALRIVGACLDVDVRRRAEETIHTQALVLQTMREGVVLLDRAGHIELTNAAFDRLFCSSAQDLTGSSISDLIGVRSADKASRSAGERRLERLRNQTGACDVLFRRRDGTEFTGEVVTAAVAPESAGRWLAVVWDVSERKRLEQEVLDIASTERRRFGYELHDGLCQELTGVVLIIRAMATILSRGTPPTVRQLDDVVDLISAASESARAMARGLSPVTLDRGGLAPALKLLVNRARKVYNVDVRLRCKVPIELAIEETTANHLYRIAQESISNAVKHGKARTVTVRLWVDDSCVRLSVTDDGAGLPAGAFHGPGMGLKVMEYRTRLMGGVIDVVRRRGGGTAIHCVCPVSLSPRTTAA